jgi:hypothetical protein
MFVSLMRYWGILICDNNNNNSILYFNVLTQQPLEPITESAQDDKNVQKINNYLQNSNINDS